jgi:hypothetical protein
MQRGFLDPSVGPNFPAIVQVPWVFEKVVRSLLDLMAVLIQRVL